MLLLEELERALIILNEGGIVVVVFEDLILQSCLVELKQSGVALRGRVRFLEDDVLEVVSLVGNCGQQISWFFVVELYQVLGNVLDLVEGVFLERLHKVSGFRIGTG